MAALPSLFTGAASCTLPRLFALIILFKDGMRSPSTEVVDTLWENSSAFYQ
jgi:hypothetical protein